MFGNLSEYTSDELLEVSRTASNCFVRGGSNACNNLHLEANQELYRRRAIRNAWLDYCNEVAGEVIA